MSRDFEVPEEMVERLRDDTRRAVERHKEPPADVSGPRPGDLFVSPATAEHDVEWLVAARRGNEVLVVAADADPQVGSGDVEVPEDEPGGPLVLHCRCAAWVDATTFDPEHLGGRLERHRADAAHTRWRRLETGTATGSPLERETDADPAYQDRAEELAAARDALLRHAAELEHRRQRRRFTGGAGSTPVWLRAVAALLLVALMAALWWGSAAWRRVEELSGPTLIAGSAQLTVGSTLRSDSIEIRPSGSGQHLLLDLLAGDDLPEADRYQAVLLDHRERELARLDLAFTGIEASVIVPRSLLPPGTYLLRIEDPATDPPAVLDEEVLRILPTH